MTFRGDILAKFVFGVDTWHTDTRSAPGELKLTWEREGRREGEGAARPWFEPPAQPAVAGLPQQLSAKARYAK